MYSRLPFIHSLAMVGLLVGTTIPTTGCSEQPKSSPQGATMSSTPVSGAAAQPPAGQRSVFVNGQRIDAATLAALQSNYRMQIADGRYWYDPISGAAGPEGGPTLAFIVPGLQLGGPLAPNASHGNTQVFVNGRELPAWDLAGLTRLVGYIAPGRYFLDAMGNAGIEGGPPTVNLIAASQQSRGSGNDGWYSNTIQAGGNESGGTGYVMGKDASGNTWSASYGN